jgi:glycosyltransferase involved in cell wall biosynthesis
MIAYFCIDSLNSSFEKNELENFLEHFEEVILVTPDKKCKMLENNKLTVKLLEFDRYKTSTYLLKSLKFFPLFLGEFFSTVKYALNFKVFLLQVSTFLRACYISDQLHELIKPALTQNKKVLLYSFWFNQFATSFAILRSNKKLTHVECVTRAHGTDLFENRVPVLKRIAFRSFQLNGIDKVCSVSEKGTRYLKKKYPRFAGKIATSRLGTKSFGTNPFNTGEPFTIVSCAHIRNIKRIHLIPLILQQLDFDVKWVHIGGEHTNDPTFNLFQNNLSDLIKSKQNITVELLGDIPNTSVFNFYRKHQVNLFLSVSETEGLPVSMMEAISFGIPVMATDVGGCNEIVTDNTGILIPKDFLPMAAAKTIAEFKRSDKNNSAFRAGVVEFWKNNFEMDKNFREFLQLCTANA